MLLETNHINTRIEELFATIRNKISDICVKHNASYLMRDKESALTKDNIDNEIKRIRLGILKMTDDENFIKGFDNSAMKLKLEIFKDDVSEIRIMFAFLRLLYDVYHIPMVSNPNSIYNNEIIERIIDESLEVIMNECKKGIINILSELITLQLYNQYQIQCKNFSSFNKTLSNLYIILPPQYSIQNCLHVIKNTIINNMNPELYDKYDLKLRTKIKHLHIIHEGIISFLCAFKENLTITNQIMNMIDSCWAYYKDDNNRYIPVWKHKLYKVETLINKSLVSSPIDMRYLPNLLSCMNINPYILTKVVKDIESFDNRNPIKLRYATDYTYENLMKIQRSAPTINKNHYIISENSDDILKISSLLFRYDSVLTPISTENLSLENIAAQFSYYYTPLIIEKIHGDQLWITKELEAKRCLHAVTQLT